MKASSLDTHMGNIAIDSEVIAQYAGSVAMECKGRTGETFKDGQHDKRDQGFAS